MMIQLSQTVVDNMLEPDPQTWSWSLMSLKFLQLSQLLEIKFKHANMLENNRLKRKVYFISKGLSKTGGYMVRTSNLFTFTLLLKIIFKSHVNDDKIYDIQIAWYCLLFTWVFSAGSDSLTNQWCGEKSLLQSSSPYSVSPELVGAGSGRSDRDLGAGAELLKLLSSCQHFIIDIHSLSFKFQSSRIQWRLEKQRLIDYFGLLHHQIIHL